MNLRFLLDTNIIVRWFAEPKKLSREQSRVIREAELRGEPLAISAMTLIEIAMLRREGRTRVEGSPEQILQQVEEAQNIHILPITIPIAVEAGQLSILRDPADRTIAATARAHGLRR